MTTGRRLLSGGALGAAAGAAGTTALNTVTYLDMALRGRPSSSTPQEAVKKLADKAEIQIPGDGDTQENRVSGLGPLLGILTGVGAGSVFGVVRRAGWRPPLPVAALVTAALAMAGSDSPMTVLGLTDPRSWSKTDWLSDIVPHLAYGLVTAAVADALDQ